MPHNIMTTLVADNIIPPGQFVVKFMHNNNGICYKSIMVKLTCVVKSVVNLWPNLYMEV